MLLIKTFLNHRKINEIAGTRIVRFKFYRNYINNIIDRYRKIKTKVKKLYRK